MLSSSSCLTASNTLIASIKNMFRDIDADLLNKAGAGSDDLGDFIDQCSQAKIEYEDKLLIIYLSREIFCNVAKKILDKYFDNVINLGKELIIKGDANDLLKKIRKPSEPYRKQEIKEDKKEDKKAKTKSHDFLMVNQQDYERVKLLHDILYFGKNKINMGTLAEEYTVSKPKELQKPVGERFANSVKRKGTMMLSTITFGFIEKSGITTRDLAREFDQIFNKYDITQYVRSKKDILPEGDNSEKFANAINEIEEVFRKYQEKPNLLSANARVELRKFHALFYEVKRPVMKMPGRA